MPFDKIRFTLFIAYSTRLLAPSGKYIFEVIFFSRIGNGIFPKRRRQHFLLKCTVPLLHKIVKSLSSQKKCPFICVYQAFKFRCYRDDKVPTSPFRHHMDALIQRSKTVPKSLVRLMRLTDKVVNQGCKNSEQFHCSRSPGNPALHTCVKTFMFSHNWDNNSIVDVHDSSSAKLLPELSKIIRVRCRKQTFFGYFFLADAPLDLCTSL
jgi:hypothetical protein